VTLGILLPTRGRPENLRRFIAAVGETADDWHIYVRLDDDDPREEEYIDVLDECGWDGYVSAFYGERIGFGASLNELAAYADRDGTEHLGMFGDDVVPETPCWDTRLVEGLGEDLGVAYGDDGLRDKHQPDLPTHYITQIEVYQRLGYLAPPTIQHLFLDNVARDIGRHLKNFVFVPVKIKHLHPWAEGEQIDDITYKEGGRNPGIRKADRKAYLRWAGNGEWKHRLR
jgi:hypothetical protein